MPNRLPSLSDRFMAGNGSISVDPHSKSPIRPKDIEVVAHQVPNARRPLRLWVLVEGAFDCSEVGPGEVIEEVCLAGEIVADGRLADTQLPRDIGDGNPVISLVGKQLEGRVEDQLAARGDIWHTTRIALDGRPVESYDWPRAPDGRPGAQTETGRREPDPKS